MLEVGKRYTHPDLSGSFKVLDELLYGEYVVCWYTAGGAAQAIDRITPTEKFMEEVIDMDEALEKAKRWIENDNQLRTYDGRLT
jgi:hypothetical protein